MSHPDERSRIQGVMIDGKDMTKADALKILIAHPQLIQRPIIEINGKFILGRPVDKVEKLLRTF